MAQGFKGLKKEQKTLPGEPINASELAYQNWFIETGSQRTRGGGGWVQEHRLFDNFCIS